MSAIEKILSYFDLEKKQKPEIVAQDLRSGVYRNTYSISYNGEKNLGEAGPIVRYSMDYEGLRLRSWQSLIENEVVQTIINKYCIWVIGSGLKLTSEPAKEVLLSEGIKLDSLKFSQQVEQRFNLYKTSKISDYSGMNNLDSIAHTAYLNALVGGDVLVVLRYDGSSLKVELIDGSHIQSPSLGTESYPKELASGNSIINGIEINQQKKHIRYYIKTKNLQYTTIEAFGKNSGLQMAFLVKGLNYRLDNIRGIPLVSAVLEKLKKMERYESATLGSAEERQKIVYQIVHDQNSTGETPLAKSIAKASNWDENSADLPLDSSGNSLANTVAASTNKQTFNMGVGAKLESLESKNELYFKEFYDTNIIAVCAALGIPYQVATSKYEGSFSASRAALKDWENTLNVTRKRFSDAFYQPIYNLWLEIEILESKIQADGYVSAKFKNNQLALEAFRKCRFVGSSVPHIDPLKEVKAVRELLGATGKDMPLITLEQATEMLNGGESSDNVLQYAAELENSKKLGIDSTPPAPVIKPATI